MRARGDSFVYLGTVVHRSEQLDTTGEEDPNHSLLDNVGALSYFTIAVVGLYSSMRYAMIDGDILHLSILGDRNTVNTIERAGF